MKPILTFPCYEPDRYRVELTEADLVQHVLVTGSTGCGKSTLLSSAIHQLIALGPRSLDRKIGLLILDAKVDGLAEQVRLAALAAGREADVQVFGPTGDTSFDLFAGCSLVNVERLTRRILMSAEPVGGDNAYWQLATSAMVSSALTLVASSGQPAAFAGIIELMRQWFLSPTTPPQVEGLVRRIQKLAPGRHSAALALAVDQVELWEHLDGRTRSNTQSCLLNVLRPLLTPAAARCFDPCGSAVGSPALAATQGSICVVSVSALTEPDLAKFFFRAAKQEFFDAVQSRRQGTDHRLCGLVADEFPLVVTREDIEQLATVRSKRCFVIAATQGLDALAQRLGAVGGRAIVNHFNTSIFMRGRETETALCAFIALGNRRASDELHREDEFRWGRIKLFASQPSQPTNFEVPVCPVGALGRLEPHQAFILFADGQRTEHPVWFVPWFEAAATRLASMQTHSVPPAEEPRPETDPYFSASHVKELMRGSGFRPSWTPEVIAAATKLLDCHRQQTLETVTGFFRSRACMVPEGLERLPACWLAGLPKILWRLRKPYWTRLLYFIDRVVVEDGMLLLGYAQEQPHATGGMCAWDRVRVAVNASLYPSLWRPLKPQHRQQLLRLHPELKSSLRLPAPDLY